MSNLIHLRRPARQPDRPRVLLLWPGGLFASRPSFGVPQLLQLAAAIRLHTGAEVDVVDLDMERALGPFDVALPFKRSRYDVIGISCYSSLDYLKVMALAKIARAAAPNACLVTGGYHPSARPEDLIVPESAFDHVVVGDGELAIVALIKDIAAGKKPEARILGPDPVHDPAPYMDYDFGLLQKYRGVAARVAGEAEIYLSRGCPYGCSFCMETAKRDTSWRSMEALAAVEQLRKLDRFLDLRGWTVRVPDALFGMKSEWRKTFLEQLARQPLPAEKLWLVMRLDLIDREDMELMARANVACGFGLESGDPGQLRRIRKTGKLHGYLEKMITIAEWARELNVAFGANVIAGHPGETEASMRTSAAYMRRLFLNNAGTHGFLAVDPFRLYPGSPIDEHLEDWKAETGMQVHRYPWWHDGDQDFLAEWINPSYELDYVRSRDLRHELFDPILKEIPHRFSYQGPGREYMRRAAVREVKGTSEGAVRRMRNLHSLWSKVVAMETSLPATPTRTTATAPPAGQLA